ncbi:hypothetical protein DL770_000243 [Monosporascus sp. CRB-9-2]|nr:hypothetical protein DL770_000243 [Monosporascus sp. CRB-9-2]
MESRDRHGVELNSQQIEACAWIEDTVLGIYREAVPEEKTANAHDAAAWLNDRVRLSRERVFMNDLTGHLYDEGTTLLDRLEEIIRNARPSVLALHVFLPVVVEICSRQAKLADHKLNLAQLQTLAKSGITMVVAFLSSTFQQGIGTRADILTKEAITWGLIQTFHLIDEEEYHGGHGYRAALPKYSLSLFAHVFYVEALSWGLLKPEDDSFFVEAMETVFETKALGSRPKIELATHLYAASLWINSYGGKIITKIATGEAKHEYYPSGPLYDGKPTLDAERWNWWREQFIILARETQDPCLQMDAQKMAVLEYS